MKRILFLLLSVVLLTGSAGAWQMPGESADNPITVRYFTTLYANTILPITANTGSIGSAANAFNASWQDSTRTGYIAGPSTSIFIGSHLVPTPTGTQDLGASGGRYHDLWLSGAIVNTWVVGTGLGKNNVVDIRPDKDNPYIALSDSATSAARTRDSIVYNGASFIHTKPLVMTVYAAGTRPATAELGQMITIDGTTTSDSLLVYLGGAWVVLKP